MSNQPTLQTVERALTFLEHVAAASEPPTVQDVSVALKLNITTCYHLMRTLLARGYLERRQNATLALGNKVSTLYGAYQQSFSIHESLAATVNRLADETSETCYFSALEGGSVIIKVLVEGSQPLRVSGLYVGLTGNEYRRSSGRAVLAHVGAEKRAMILANSLSGLSLIVQESITKELEQELEATRQRGWSMDGEQTELGISSIGAPVFDSEGEVYGAVGVVAPTFRMDRSKSELISFVTAAAREATGMLCNVKTTK
jgi:IclR family acetate operon transcriptional repressor